MIHRFAGKATLADMQNFAAARRSLFYPKTDLPFLSQLQPGALPDLKHHWFARHREAIEKVFRGFTERPTLQAELIPTAGTGHVIVRLTEASANLYILRISSNPDGPAEDMLLDALAEPIRNEAGHGIGTLIRSDFSRAVLPFDFALHRVAEGICLREMEDPAAQAMPKGVLAALGRALARVHSVPASGWGLLDPGAAALGRVQGVHGQWCDYLQASLAEHLAVCISSGSTTIEETIQAQSLFDRAITTLADVPCRLLHGDPGHHNAFVSLRDAPYITALIDWEDALAGDPIFDLAYWGTFVRDPMREDLLADYFTHQDKSADFEFRYWLYYLRIAISKTVYRHRAGFTDRPGRPPASLRIQKALDQLQRLGALSRA